MTDLYGCHFFAPQSRLRKGDDELIKHIYEHGAGGVNDVLLQRYAGGFDKAVMQVFGAGRQYPELERELRLNAGRFGTYKTYDLCRELERARGLPFDRFKKIAGVSVRQYNAWQKTEYNTMVGRSRTAKQWERFKEEKHLYPNIEWLRTSSTTPREEHLEYVGLILPVDDSFWTYNQPRNLYNCNCSWRNTDKPTTLRPKKNYEPAAGLDGNPAQTGELVTEEHPYFKRNQTAPAWVDNKAILQCPDEVCFIEKTTPNGNKYREHLLAGKTAEATDNRAFAALLAENGYRDVKLLPQIYKNETSLRARYFGKDYAARHSTNPDASVGGNLIEFKTSNRRNLSSHILNATKKSKLVFVYVTEPMTESNINRFVKGQWNMSDRKNLNELILYVNGELQVFKRP